MTNCYTNSKGQTIYTKTAHFDRSEYREYRATINDLKCSGMLIEYGTESGGYYIEYIYAIK